MDTLQSAIISTKVTTSQKQRISALAGRWGGKGGRGRRGRGGGGNHYQGKHPYKVARRRRGGCGARGSSDKSVRFNDQRNPPQWIDWVEYKFYEPVFYANVLEEQKIQLNELKNNRSATPPATPKLASVELRLLQLEQLASTLTPPEPIVASNQGVSQVGVQPQYTNATNPALQLLNQRSWNEEEANEVDTGDGLEISSVFAQNIKEVLNISA